MDLKNTRIQIGQLIDHHCRRCRFNGDYHRDVCELCPVYKELRRLGDQLLNHSRSKTGREIERLLAKGRKLTPLEVMRLYELEVDRHSIAAALEVPHDRLYRYNDLYIRPIVSQWSDRKEGGLE